MRSRAITLPSGTRGREYNFNTGRSGSSQGAMLGAFYGSDKL